MNVWTWLLIICVAAPFALLARRDGADLNVYAAHTSSRDDTITIHVGDERAAQAVRALYPGATIVEE